MKSKFERGLIRPEAFLDLHGYNRVDAEKTLEDFIKTCIYKEFFLQEMYFNSHRKKKIYVRF